MSLWLQIIVLIGSLAAILSVFRSFLTSTPAPTASSQLGIEQAEQLAQLQIDFKALKRLVSELEDTVETRHKSVMQRINRASPRRDEESGGELDQLELLRRLAEVGGSAPEEQPEVEPVRRQKVIRRA